MSRFVSLLGLFAFFAAPALKADSVVVFNEIMYHPPAATAAAEAAAEWVELCNQMAVDVDMSGWSLSGGVNYVFPQGTVLNAGSYLVVAATPGSIPGALGPWSGKLDNGGEKLELKNNSGRVMDEISYGTEGDWPTAPDGGGASLARRSLNTASGDAASWRSSLQTGGTAGTGNFADSLPPVETMVVNFDASWKYLATGADPGSTWKNGSFNDAAWSTGTAGFRLGSDTLPAGITANTVLPSGPTTYYFRRAFTWNGDPAKTTLKLQLCVDDGAAVYLNGVELTRTNLPTGSLTVSTKALDPKRSAPVSQEFILPIMALQNGNNVLAVEVHQAPALTQGSAMLYYNRGASPAAARLDGPYTIGSRIQTGGTSQQLTHLGVQDADAAVDANDPDGVDNLSGYPDDDGFLNGATGIQVGIWDGAGTLLRSATVTSTDPHFAGWRYKSISPLTLNANTTYYIGARIGAGIEWFLDSYPAATYAAESGFTFTQSTFSTAGALAWPTSDGLVTGRWGAANALVGAQASFTVGADTTDAAFAARLITVGPPPTPAVPTLALNEVSLNGVEIMNTGGAAMDLTGATLRQVSSSGTISHPLPAQSLAAGGFLQLSLTLPDGARLVLLAADGVTVIDSAVVKLNPRARFPNGTGPWLRPAGESFGSANAISLHDDVVINEIMFDHPDATLLPPGSPQPGQWIELYNKSASTVDLSGWKMDGGVEYTFPAGTTLAPGAYVVLVENAAAFIAGHSLPASQVFGPWSGNLSHGHDRLVLQDASGNPADEVTYFAEGRWPVAANAGGSSMELRDSRSDNTIAESWAASDESSKAAWQTFTWNAVNNPSIAGEPTDLNELNLLLVDGPGECLVDDIRVTDTITSANLIVNGGFDSGATGWRFLGNHRTSSVQPEPGNSSNSVLRLVASGPGEYQGNQIAATYNGNTALVAGRTYQISLRARWLNGGGRLNTRQYFDRMPRTHVLAVVGTGGTPGQPNTRAVANAGPVYRNFSHSPVVPAAGQPVVVAVNVADPDGVNTVNLKYAVSGGSWQTVAMGSTDGLTYTGTIPGQASGSVQFYVESSDTPGAVSAFPARGAQSRAMYYVYDGRGTGALRRVRLVMTPADVTFMHTSANTLSNEELGASLIVNDRDVYYDIGVRLKGSYVGRDVPRVGFNLLFQSDRLFRGVHEKVAVDRSQHATVGAIGETIAKHIASSAGGIPNMYDDIAQFIHPSPTYSSIGQLRMAGFEKEFLDGQYPKGGDGTLIEMEGFRWSAGYLGIDLGNYGTDKEVYRWFMLQTMNRDRNDYSYVIPFMQMFSLTGSAFETAARQRLDYDEFLRTMAYQALVGPGDTIYTGTNLHNCRFFFRPHDGRAVYMPWDWDSVWQLPTSAPLIGSGNLAKIVTVSPDATRRYYFQLNDLIQTTYNTTYMSRWTQHYGTVSGQDFSGVLTYIGQRASFVQAQMPTGTAFSASAGTPTANGAVTLTGQANINVAYIEVNGVAYTPTWTSNTGWTVTVPLVVGSNTLVIRGLTKNGTLVAGASQTLNVENPNAPGWADIRINEWMAENDGSVLDPADNDADDWIELYNPTAQPVSLAGWKLSDTPANPSLFTIPSGWSIPAHGYLIIWADNETAQNPATPSPTSELHVNFKLSKDGETLILSAPDNHEMDRVTFGGQASAITEGRIPDGETTLRALTLPSPGEANVFTEVTSIDFFSATPEVTISTTPGWTYQVESSDDLVVWVPWSAAVTATGTSMNLPAPPAGSVRFYRVRTER